MVNRILGLKSGYILALIICTLPLIIGLIVLLAPAFSWLPMLDQGSIKSLSLTPWYKLFSQPTLSSSIQLTLFITTISTLLSILFSFILISQFYASRLWSRLIQTLYPVFALPHIAFAVGFLFLFSPSGWIFRFFNLFTPISPNNTLLLVQDPHAIGVSIALAIKETVFLILMSVAPLQQLKIKQSLVVGQSLGYTPTQVWLKTLLPQWLANMRLPLVAVIGYSLSVVDINLVLAPLRPAPFSVQIWQWVNDGNLQLFPMIAAGSILLLSIALVTIVVARFAEFFLFKLRNFWQFNGIRKNFVGFIFEKSAHLVTLVLTLIPLFCIILLVLWSFSLRWRFPDLFASRWSMQFWEDQLGNLSALFSTSLTIAIISTAIGILFAILCLEHQAKSGRGLPLFAIVLPLVVPQLSLLFGVQIITISVPYITNFTWVVWGHLLYVFPYVYLSLSPTWKSFNPSYMKVANSLGYSPFMAWWKIKLPILKNGVIMSVIVGMSVSLTQYLPTVMLGNSRIATITTEAVALTSGQDRRIIAVYGLMQALLPLILLIGSRYFMRGKIMPAVVDIDRNQPSLTKQYK